MRRKKARCLTYKGECIDTRYVYRPEPNDFQSGLIRRCAVAIDLGAAVGDVLQVCFDAGQSETHAWLTYNAALLLSQGRRPS